MSVFDSNNVFSICLKRCINSIKYSIICMRCAGADPRSRMYPRAGKAAQGRYTRTTAVINDALQINNRHFN